jgi:hypothetical protein
VVLAGAAGLARNGGPAQRMAAMRMAAGLIVSVVATVLAFRTQTQHYAQNVLPVFSAHLPAQSLHSHSVPTSFGAAAPIVSAVIVLAWCIAAHLTMGTSPEGVFAGALAISTYVARTSFDYNLITTYPLLVFLAALAFSTEPGSRGAAVALFLGLAGITSHREWFGGHAMAHVALQITWLAVTAAFQIGWCTRRSRGSAAPQCDGLVEVPR